MYRSPSGNQHRTATSHRLQHSQAPGLVLIGEKKGVTCAVEILYLFIGNFAGKCFVAALTLDANANPRTLNQLVFGPS